MKIHYQEVLHELVRIYSIYHEYNAMGCPEYCSLCETYQDVAWFNESRKKIETLRRQVDSRIKIHKSAKGQILESLVFLNKKKKGRDLVGFQYGKEMISAIFNNHWTSDQITYFQEYSNLIEVCDHDYFLSFTSRKPNQDEINILHSRHEHFIRDVLMISNWKKELSHAKLNKTNLLARAINRLLNAQSLTGFYYPNRFEDNSILEDKLRKGCESAFSFVQIIQNIMFVKPPKDQPNYCFWEFDFMTTQLQIPESRKFYILAEYSRNDLIPFWDVNEEYETWHQEVTQKDNIHLEPTQSRSHIAIKQNKKKIRESLVKLIYEQKDRIFRNVPD